MERIWNLYTVTKYRQICHKVAQVVTSSIHISVATSQLYRIDSV